MKLKNIRLLEKRKDRKLRELGFLTFSGWIGRGRAVKKGQKAKVWTSKGRALFAFNQTEEIPVTFTLECPEEWTDHLDV